MLDIKEIDKPFNTNVTFSKDVHNKIVKIAKEHGVSNSQVVDALLRKVLVSGKDTK